MIDRLKAGFVRFAETARTAWKGIVDAVRTGDLGLAARIALATVTHGSKWTPFDLTGRVVRLGDGEAFVRFCLTESLDRCGSAVAKRVVFKDGKWCPIDSERTVHDSLGVVCPDLCAGDDPPGEGCECVSATSVLERNLSRRLGVSENHL